MVKHITYEDFQKEVVESKGILLVDFFATWCGPCQMLSPVLEEFSEESQIDVIKLDIDKETALAIENGIEVVPTVLIYKDGNLVERFEGFREKEEIIKIVNSIK